MSDVRQRLMKYQRIIQRIKFNERQIESLSEGLALPATTNVSDTPVQGGQQGDRLPIKLQQIEDLRAEIANCEELRDGWHKELWDIVGSLPSEFEICVVRSYYFWLLDREQVAEQLFGDRDDFKVNRNGYLRRITKLHGDAMRNLQACNTQPMRLDV